MKHILFLFAFIVLYQTSTAQDWQEMADAPLDLAFPVVVELNGNIHVMGGGAGQGATAFHFRYEPATNDWDTLAFIPYLAQQPAGAVVNGKIHYCGGGFPNSGTPLDDHYYYDPTLDEWFEAEALPTARVIHEAVSLDGKLYVMTGQPDKQRFDVYDPANNLWTQLNDLPDQNFWYGAIVATNNTIYRFGGGGYIVPQDIAHEYDKVNDEWNTIADLPQALHAPAGVAVNDFLICISGGYNVDETDEVWLYNIITNEYDPTEALPTARAYHSLAIADGCIYSVGGNNEGFDIGLDMLQNCEISANDIPVVNDDSEKPYEISFTPDALQIQFHASVMNEEAAIKVVDMTGRTVHGQSLKNPSATTTISSEKLSAGMHLVMLVIGERSFVEEWVVHQ